MPSSRPRTSSSSRRTRCVNPSLPRSFVFRRLLLTGRHFFTAWSPPCYSYLSGRVLLVDGDNGHPLVLLLNRSTLSPTLPAATPFLLFQPHRPTPPAHHHHDARVPPPLPPHALPQLPPLQLVPIRPPRRRPPRERSRGLRRSRTGVGVEAESADASEDRCVRFLSFFRSRNRERERENVCVCKGRREADLMIDLFFFLLKKKQKQN